MFHVGVRQYLDVLIGNIKAHPNFKKVTEGLDLSLSLVIKTPESFKRFGMSDTHVYLHVVDQRVEFNVGAKSFKADISVEGDWATWTKILSGQEDLVDSITAEEIKISGNLEKLRFDLIPVLAESIEKAKTPPEILKLRAVNPIERMCYLSPLLLSP